MRILTEEVWGGAVLTGSQVMPVMLVHGPLLEQQGFKRSFGPAVYTSQCC